MAGERRIARPDTALPDWHIPDAAYRPIPIAWFAAAFLIQMVVLTGLFVLLVGRSGWITIIAATLATLLIGGWTWERGMKDAGAGWRTASVVVLGLQLALIALGAAARA
jgi:hypothetical protein